MIRRALLGSFLLLVIAFGVARADAPVSLADYRAAVQKAHALIERAQAEANHGTRAELYGQALAALGITEVEVAPGVIMPVANNAITRDLEQLVKGYVGVDTAALRSRLAALDAALGIPLAAPDAADRARLREIFNRPPFAQEPDNPLLRALQPLVEWLDRLLSNVGRGVFDLRDTIAVLGTVAVLVVLIFLLRSLWRHMGTEAELKNGAGDAPLTAAGALDQARRSADAGDYRSAARQLYLATLLILEERGLLHYDRTLTNREYLDLVRGTPAVHAALLPVIQTFDRVWYGYGTLVVRVGAPAKLADLNPRSRLTWTTPQSEFSGIGRLKEEEIELAESFLQRREIDGRESLGREIAQHLAARLEIPQGMLAFNPETPDEFLSQVVASYRHRQAGETNPGSTL